MYFQLIRDDGFTDGSASGMGSGIAGMRIFKRDVFELNIDYETSVVSFVT